MAETVIMTASEGGFTVEGPYSADWVEGVKADIPHTERRWDPEAKAWWVEAEYLDTVTELSEIEGWTIRIEWGDGHTEVRYPSGEIEHQQQDSLL